MRVVVFAALKQEVRGSCGLGSSRVVGVGQAGRRSKRRGMGRPPLLLGLGVVLACSVALAALAHQYVYFDWDLGAAHYLQSIGGYGFGELMTWISAIGSGWSPPLLVAVAATILWKRGMVAEAVVCASGVGLGGLFNRLLKLVVDRPRPPNSLVQVVVHHPSESFPSGHVVFFVGFFGFLAFLACSSLERVSDRVAALSVCAIFTLLVGPSRVYLGAHWPSDVLGAYLFGGLWLSVMIGTYRSLKGRQPRP